MSGKKDKALSLSEWRMANFSAALGKIPPAIPCFSNGAICPWCGMLHETVTFGQNECTECRRQFLFGIPVGWETRIPDWPESWVDFPSHEFDLLGGNASLIPEFVPTDRLKEIWKQVDEVVKQQKIRQMPEGVVLQ
ncbi:hypothetical protein [uncultured Cohaesibacter sp.]|uniref:hypothetical protein n=1 Tax=uncultured Cohaesibacter sp. TaxID=1002546 RepID=UPI0029C6EE92|nr:hypothetical protein [uncultured Cohaesibacter sp.]